MGSVTDLLPASPIASSTETTQHGMSAAPDAERLKFHPVADIFPLLEEPALSALAADIREHGLHDDIVLHPDDGSIVDGRNRYLACLDAGVKPRFRDWDGEGSLLDYVVSENLHRRHLNASQRAMVAAEIAKLEHGQRQTGKLAGLATQAQAAKPLNVSERSVRDARVVRDSGNTELVARVKKGEISVSKAAQAVRPRRTRRKPTATKPSAASTNLSRRWLEVKDLAEEGCSSRLIAAKLGLEHERLLKQAHITDSCVNNAILGTGGVEHATEGIGSGAGCAAQTGAGSAR
jgi:ParB-like chromosome segregation protein Spo0J